MNSAPCTRLCALGSVHLALCAWLYALGSMHLALCTWLYMAAYLAGLKRLKTEYLREDGESKISDKAFAQRMLSKAALTKRVRMDVFYNVGGKHRSEQIEKVLRFRCAAVHMDEKSRSWGRGTHGDDRKPKPYARKLGSMHSALCTRLYALGSICTWLYALGSMHLALCTWLYARLYALGSVCLTLRK